MKPDSLKTILNRIIRERGQISYGEFVEICLQEGHKISNGERRLRKSESPSVEPIMAKSKRNTPYIAGYKWVGEVKHETVTHTGLEGFSFIYKVDPKHAVTSFNPPL